MVKHCINCSEPFARKGKYICDVCYKSGVRLTDDTFADLALQIANQRVPETFASSVPKRISGHDSDSSARKVVLAATQFECGSSTSENVAKAEEFVRRAHQEGAQIILLQELFQSVYFPQEQLEDNFDLAAPLENNAMLQKMSGLAAELKVVLPVSFFERSGPAHFNSCVVFDADGRNLGLYRKSHIPDGPGYQEKFYFSPGDTGFKVFKTMYGCIGVGICWDQWFPEAARSMVLQGAELLLYPTAIGSEPQDPTLDSFPHWKRVMQGHSAANVVPVVASNRVGTESAKRCESSITFYGGSFITGSTGEILAAAPQSTEAVVLATVDLDANQRQRRAWGLFRDRRPDLYGSLLTLDGKSQ